MNLDLTAKLPSLLELETVLERPTLSSSTVATLIAERDYYMSNKGARTNSVRDRITRIESVIVAREKILSEMLKKKEKEPIAKQAEGIDMAAIPPTIVT